MGSREPPQNLLLAGSLQSLLSSASGLDNYILSLPLGWAHPDAGLQGRHPGCGVSFCLRCSPRSPPAHTPAASTPLLKVLLDPMPRLHIQVRDLGPSLSGRRNLTRDPASLGPSLASSSPFTPGQERAASRKGGTEGREGILCRQMTKGQGILEGMPCTKHAAPD